MDADYFRNSCEPECPQIQLYIVFMRNPWWHHFGKIGAALFLAGIALWRRENKTASFTGLALTGLAIIITVIYFFMQQKDEEQNKSDPA